jgi:hypothetical protein
MHMTTHWHVASGLAGYGPDGDDGYADAVTWRELADLLHGELNQVAEYLHEVAEGEATDGDKALAYDLIRKSEEAERLARNLDDSRADAPLYADNADLRDATVEALVESHFPYYYDHTVGPGNAARLALYAWPCEAGSECEHVEDDEDPRAYEG